jgi:hypothetical protein
MKKHMIKTLKKQRCKHGFFNCLLCYEAYVPTSDNGINKYLKLILDKPLSTREVVFLKSKIKEEALKQEEERNARE